MKFILITLLSVLTVNAQLNNHQGVLFKYPDLATAQADLSNIPTHGVIMVDGVGVVVDNGSGTLINPNDNSTIASGVATNTATIATHIASDGDTDATNELYDEPRSVLVFFGDSLTDQHYSSQVAVDHASYYPAGVYANGILQGDIAREDNSAGYGGGVNVAVNPQNWTRQIKKDFVSNNTYFKNYGLYSMTTAQIRAEVEARFDPASPYYDSNLVLNDGDKGYFTVMAGYNDWGGSDNSGAIYADLQAIWSLARSQGYEVIQISSKLKESATAEGLATGSLIKSDPSLYDYHMDMGLSHKYAKTRDGIHWWDYAHDSIANWWFYVTNGGSMDDPNAYSVGSDGIFGNVSYAVELANHLGVLLTDVDVVGNAHSPQVDSVEGNDGGIAVPLSNTLKINIPSTSILDIDGGVGVFDQFGDFSGKEITFNGQGLIRFNRRPASGSNFPLGGVMPDRVIFNADVDLSKCENYAFQSKSNAGSKIVFNGVVDCRTYGVGDCFAFFSNGVESPFLFSGSSKVITDHANPVFDGRFDTGTKKSYIFQSGAELIHESQGEFFEIISGSQIGTHWEDGVKFYGTINNATAILQSGVTPTASTSLDYFRH